MSVKLIKPGRLKRELLDNLLDRSKVQNFTNQKVNMLAKEEIYQTPECELLLAQALDMEEQIQKMRNVFVP